MQQEKMSWHLEVYIGDSSDPCSPSRDEGADIVVVARTDARQADSLTEALWRAAAFADAGADVLFIDALESVDEMRAFAGLGGTASTLPKVCRRRHFDSPGMWMLQAKCGHLSWASPMRYAASLCLPLPADGQQSGGRQDAAAAAGGAAAAGLQAGRVPSVAAGRVAAGDAGGSGRDCRRPCAACKCTAVVPGEPCSPSDHL